MPDETQVVLETENQAGDDNQEGQEGGKEQQAQAELSPYEQQLQEIRAEKAALEERLAAKEKQIELKDKALKRKAEPQVPADLDDRLQNLVQKELRKRDVDTKLRSLTEDKAAQEILKHHLEKSIVSSGDVDKDIEMAWAITNAPKMREILARREAAENYEDVVASLQAGSTVGSNPNGQSSKSPVRRQAEELLKMMNPKAIKNLEI